MLILNMSYAVTDEQLPRDVTRKPKSALINRTVLMSGPDHFSVDEQINPYYADEPVNRERLLEEHGAIREALESTGVKVVKVDPPAGCQDGVFTANWAVTSGNIAVMS